MTGSELHAVPSAGEVVREQIRMVGRALRRPALVAGGLLALATLTFVADVRGGGPILFRPHHELLPGALGVLFPLAVWRGEDRFGPGFLWILPVNRTVHALARVLAGWVWLMAAVGVFVLWLMAFTLASGAPLLETEILRQLPGPGFPAPGTLSPDDLILVRWTQTPLFWLVPFAAATGTYLLGSAVAVGVRYPGRWLAGVLLSLLLISASGDVLELRWLEQAPEAAADRVLNARYGLDALLSARTESSKMGLLLVTGEDVVVWRWLPSVRDWAVAAVLWLTGGLLALGLAVARHRELRRG